MTVRCKYFPQDITELYKLKAKKIDNWYIYILIKNGIYGLKQGALLIYKKFKKHLEFHCYASIQGTVGL